MGPVLVDEWLKVEMGSVLVDEWLEVGSGVLDERVEEDCVREVSLLRPLSTAFVSETRMAFPRLPSSFSVKVCVL